MKHGLEGQIQQLKKDLSRIDTMSKSALTDSDLRNRLRKKYKVKGEEMTIVTEEIKQRIQAKKVQRL